MNRNHARDLEIRILRSDRRSRTCPVEIVGPSDSRATGRFRSPFTDEQIRDAIVALDLGQFDSGLAREFGEALFRALIRDGIKAIYDASGGEAQPVGVRLTVDDPAAARIPWELMVDPVVGTPFATRHRLVRGFSTSTEARPMSTEPPLRILVADSAPVGVERLASQLEVDDIRDALRGLTAGRRVAVETMRNAGEDSLLNHLREGAEADPPRPVHVLHWIGHGGVDPDNGSTVLLFEQDDGRRDLVNGKRLATILSGFDIRLVFLNACYSAAPTQETARAEFSFEVTASVAEALLTSGIPSVIGMQATVRDERARQFAHKFYKSLADGARIDAAVLDARRLVRGGAHGTDADIGIPVCYLRAGSTSLLAPRRHPFSGLVDRFGLLGRTAKWAVGGAAAALFSAAVLAAAGLIGGILFPPQMSGEFNVMVAEFLATDPSGRLVESDTAKILSANLYDSLRTELVGKEGLPNIQILAPSEAGRLTGSTPQERARAAEGLAASRNGDMVIYGSLDALGTSLQPEFYISPAFLEGAEELAGAFSLGSPIRSVAPPGNPAVGIELRRNLLSRTSAVTRFVAGLTWLASKDYPRADTEFKFAIDNTGWDDRDGKEVVYLFRGTAAALQGKLEEARAKYQEALDRNPDYGRAMNGLAEVQLHLASGGCDAETVNAPGLAAARDRFTEALVAKDQPPLSNVKAKAHFGIARVDVCLSQALVESSWAEAEEELKAVISEFEAGNATAQDLAAEAHGQMAIVRLPPGGDPDPHDNYLAAADEYRAAAELSKHNNRKAFFYDGLGWVLERLDRDADAAEAYDRAIEFAPDEPAREFYRRHRQQLDAGASTTWTSSAA